MVKTIRNITETIIVPEGTHHHVLPLQNPACQALLDADCCVAGLSTAPNGYAVERRSPPNHELLYTLSGSGQLHAADRVLPVTPGQVMVLPAKSWYRYEALEPGWRIMWFHFSNRGLWLMLERAEPHVREGIAVNELQHAVEGLLAESVRDEAESARLVALFSEQIVLYLSREVSASDNAHDRRIRQQVYDLWNAVDAQLGLDWTVGRMAAQMNMSPAHFHRVCLRYSGCSPKQMVFRLRMQRAEELLVKYDYALKNIAEELGYGTPFAFSNAFKRHKGISPEHFRRQRV
jgi:AraC-like DNA-binding protein